MLTTALRSLWNEPRPADPPRRVWRDWVLVGALLVSLGLEAALLGDLRWGAVAVGVSLWAGVRSRRVPGDNDRPREFIQSLDRGLAIIRSFGPDAPVQTVSELAVKTGLTRATTRRFLITLVELGYSAGEQYSVNVRQGGTGRRTPTLLAAGYDTTTLVVVTNTKQLTAVDPVDDRPRRGPFMPRRAQRQRVTGDLDPQVVGGAPREAGAEPGDEHVGTVGSDPDRSEAQRQGCEVAHGHLARGTIGDPAEQHGTEQRQRTGDQHEQREDGQPGLVRSQERPDQAPMHRPVLGSGHQRGGGHLVLRPPSALEPASRPVQQTPGACQSVLSRRCAAATVRAVSATTLARRGPARPADDGQASSVTRVKRRAEGLLDRDLPRACRADEHPVLAVGDRVAGCLGKARVVGQHPEQDVGVEQQAHGSRPSKRRWSSSGRGSSKSSEIQTRPCQPPRTRGSGSCSYGVSIATGRPALPITIRSPACTSSSRRDSCALASLSGRPSPTDPAADGGPAAQGWGTKPVHTRSIRRMRPCWMRR
jgi:hypothetical protein